MRRTSNLFFLLLFIPFLSIAQNRSNDSSYYNWYDDLVGVENTGLYVGYEYKDQYRITEEHHKFFQSHDFLTGSLTYNGQIFYDQELKYNVFDDDLIIKLKNKSGETVMQLINDNLDGFSINDHHFYKFQNVEEEGSYTSGFYEILKMNDHFKLIKKHSKRKIKKLDKKVIYFEYKNRKPQYFIIQNSVSYELRSKKDFTGIFPEYKNEIKEFISKSKSEREIEYKRLSDLIFQLRTK